MKKIAVNTAKAFLKAHETKDTITMDFPVGESSFEVQIRTALTIDEKTKFISRVTRNCFDAAGNYHPEFLTPMLRATVLQMCTNIPVLTIKGEAENMDLDAMDALYCAMDLDNLEEPSFRLMLGEMVALCRTGIEWRQARTLNSSNNTEAIAALGNAAVSVRNVMEALEKKLDGMDTTEMMRYAAQLSKATEGLDEGGILKGLIEVNKSSLDLPLR